MLYVTNTCHWSKWSYLEELKNKYLLYKIIRLCTHLSTNTVLINSFTAKLPLAFKVSVFYWTKFWSLSLTQHNVSLTIGITQTLNYSKERRFFFIKDVSKWKKGYKVKNITYLKCFWKIEEKDPGEKKNVPYCIETRLYYTLIIPIACKRWKLRYKKKTLKFSQFFENSCLSFQRLR